MTHQRPVALLRLDDGGRLEIELGEPVNNLIQRRDVLIIRGQVDVAALDPIAVGVQRVRPPVLVVREQPKVLRPVAQRRGGVDKRVRTSWGIGRGESLEKPAVGRVVCVPPHLLRLAGEKAMTLNR